jgi:hypothetical protein
MDLNQKIKEQSKIVEGLITKLDNLILEQEEGITPNELEQEVGDEVESSQVKSIAGNISNALQQIGGDISTDDSNEIVRMNVYLKGGEIEFKGEFDDESIDIGSSKGFKSTYDKKNQILTISGKDNKIFKDNLNDVNLSFKLPKPIDKLKYEFTPVETKQKSSKTKKSDVLENIPLQITKFKEVD